MPDDQVALFAHIPPVDSTGLDSAGQVGPVEAFPGACPSQLKRIHRGLHPMGWPMPGPAGETCGSCAHLDRYVLRSRSSLKCGIVASQTGGYATDTRVRWPACQCWEAKCPE